MMSPFFSSSRRPPEAKRDFFFINLCSRVNSNDDDEKSVSQCLHMSKIDSTYNVDHRLIQYATDIAAYIVSHLFRHLRYIVGHHMKLIWHCEPSV